MTALAFPRGAQARAAFYPSVPLVLVGAFGVYVVAWFMQIGIRRPLLGEIRFEFILASVLILAALLYWPRDPFPARPSGLAFLLAAQFLLMIMMIPFSNDVKISKLIFTERIVKFAFMAVFIVRFVRAPGDLRLFTLALLFACFYITQESFRGALNGSMVWENQGIPRLHGVTPLFNHPNSLGGLAASTVPFVYFLFSVIRPRFLRWFLLAILVTSLGCVLYSGSRASYISILAFGLYLFWVSRHKLKFLVAAVLVVCLAVPFLPPAYKARFSTIYTGKEIEGASMDTRKQIVKDAVRVFLKYPLGVGIAAFPTVRARLFGRTQDTHNMYLEVATNLGVQGLILFAILIVKLFQLLASARRGLREQLESVEARLARGADAALTRHRDDLFFIHGVCLATLGYFVMRLILGMFGSDLYEIYWWIVIGLAVSLHRMVQWAGQATNLLLAPGETDESPAPAQ